jgi:hypothetical protein
MWFMLIVGVPVSEGEKAEKGSRVDLCALGRVAESCPRVNMFSSRGCLYTWMGIRKPL